MIVFALSALLAFAISEFFNQIRVTDADTNQTDQVSVVAALHSLSGKWNRH